jgi:signal transduction histidine kinase/ligand-binding sensor domain-containing protein
VRASACLLLIAALLAAPSARAAEPDNLLTGYSLTSWTHGDGVPLGTVHAIGQDRDGYLWIGTDAGLLRFDGLRFTPWETISESPLPSAPVSALCISRDGSLWVGLGEGGGVRHLRDSRILDDHTASGLGPVSDLIEDGKGTIWAVSESALFRLRADGWQKVTLPRDVREPLVLHPYVNRQGDFWVGTSRGLYRRIEERDSFERVLTGYTWGMSQAADDSVWATDIVAGFRRAGDSVPQSPVLEGAGYRLMHDRQGSLWVATLGEGLWRVRYQKARTTPRIERTALKTGLSSDSVQSLMEDRDGNIWVGTTGGLHRLTERKLTPIENVGFVVAVEPTNDIGVWGGTTSGIMRLSATPAPWQHQRQSTQPDVRTMHRDPRGLLWIGTNDGLWRFAGGQLTRVNLPREYSASPITLLATASEGAVWLGFDNWIFRWNGRDLTRFEAPPESGMMRISYAYAEKSGRLWLAYDGGKVGYADVDGTWHALGTSEGFTSGLHDAIYTIVEDRNGDVWIGGSGGLSRFAHGRLVTINHTNGLPGQRVPSIVDDEAGFLWLSMDRGLVRLSRHEFEKAAGNVDHRVQFRLYDPSDGLAGAPLGSIRSTRDSDGRLWFVRGGGLTMVDPRAIGDDRALPPPPVRIEAAVANESRFSAIPRTSLAAGTRRLQINYTALTLTASNKIRFRYRLDGFDTAWIDAGSRRQAFYTNLSPRSYRFLVEAETEDGTWTTSSASWDFAIRPAFYQTSWFYASCIGAMGLVLWGTWRVRLQLVRRQFSLVLAERARLSREIHDTLLQSLVGVALQFDAISNSLDSSTSSSGARDQLVRIRKHVESYIREARQSIWDLRSPVLETHDLANALRNFGRRAAAGKPARFTVAVTGPPRRCTAKMENQLLRIGQEAITNAIRHAQAKRVQLDLRFEDRSVTLRVTDDGCGFVGDPAHEAENHYGLTTMRERAEELGGHLKIATVVGQGTTVEAVVPMPASG